MTSDRGVQEAPITFKKSRQRQTISPKHVQFMADSLILNAALEGDLELLKQCTRKVKHNKLYPIRQLMFIFF